MAAVRSKFRVGSISVFNLHIKLHLCAKFGAFITMWTIWVVIRWTTLHKGNTAPYPIWVTCRFSRARYSDRIYNTTISRSPSDVQRLFIQTRLYTLTHRGIPRRLFRTDAHALLGQNMYICRCHHDNRPISIKPGAKSMSYHWCTTIRDKRTKCL
jgi:hypothetical protein